METRATLKEKYKNLSHEQMLELIGSLQAKIDLLTHELYGRKSEKKYHEPYGMQCLFDEIEQCSTPEENEKNSDDQTEVSGHKRKKGGKRKPLPDYLEREVREFDLSDDQKVCHLHNIPLTRIGKNVSEKLEFIPATVKVIENVTYAYKCPCCSKEKTQDEIVKSKLPDSIIPKSFASPSLLAHIAVSKFQDGLPLYRQEKIFFRHDIDLQRSTMAIWMIQCASAAQPLINLMYDDLLERLVIGCDESKLQVLKEKHRTAQQLSYMWLTVALEGSPIVLYHYSTGRSAKVAESLLAEFTGTIVCDGLRTYDAFAAKFGILLAACMAHLRRKFVQAEKALKKADPKATPKTSEPLKMIRDLYKIEKEYRDKPPDQRLAARKNKSKPIMDDLKAWLDKMEPRVLPKSLLGKAISYAQDQWSKMLVFLDNPLVPIDNNTVESYFRPFVIGRNNWLFAATEKGAHASATLYSLIESVKANGIDPFSYLNLIFKELAIASTVDDYRKLLPHEVNNHFKLKSYQPPR